MTDAPEKIRITWDAEDDCFFFVGDKVQPRDTDIKYVRADVVADYKAKDECCEWQDLMGVGVFMTQCEEVCSMPPVANPFKYCPYCGKQIKVKE